VTGWSPPDPDQMVHGRCAGSAGAGFARGVRAGSAPVPEILGSHGFEEECALRLVWASGT
jgi:hypothetical protein